MRQSLSFREHSGRGNAPLTLIVAPQLTEIRPFEIVGVAPGPNPPRGNPEVSARLRGAISAAGTAEGDLVETRIELGRGPLRGLWGIERDGCQRGGHPGDRPGASDGRATPANRGPAASHERR